MSQFTDMFDIDTLFSRKNPIVESAGKMHRKIFETFDRTARLQLSFTEDLLDLNRKRFEALYAGNSLPEVVKAQQELVTEFGKRTATWVGDLQEVVVELQSDAGEAANEMVKPAARKTAAAKPKKAASRKTRAKKAA